MAVKQPESVAATLPLDEVIRLLQREGLFEFADGERTLLVPGVAEHSEIIKLLYAVLLQIEQQSGVIRAYSETPYVLMFGPDWVTGVRVPDVMAFATSRMTDYKERTADWKRKPFVLVPDLCVEVVSPNDIYAEVDEKVQRYLSDGVRLVWVVNPRIRSVHVYGDERTPTRRLTAEDTLDGGEILPGLALPVRDLFPA